jgi:hypothetical protein
VTTAISACVHHWRIESPSGKSTVPGTCKHCGTTRDFPASGDSWDSEGRAWDKYRTVEFK